MRTLIAVLILAYFIGIGVVLAPTVNEKWTTATASDFFASTMKELPRAAAWPATVYHSVADHPTNA